MNHNLIYWEAIYKKRLRTSMSALAHILFILPKDTPPFPSISRIGRNFFPTKCKNSSKLILPSAFLSYSDSNFKASAFFSLNTCYKRCYHLINNITFHIIKYLKFINGYFTTVISIKMIKCTPNLLFLLRWKLIAHSYISTEILFLSLCCGVTKWFVEEIDKRKTFNLSVIFFKKFTHLITLKYSWYNEMNMRKIDEHNLKEPCRLYRRVLAGRDEEKIHK